MDKIIDDNGKNYNDKEDNHIEERGEVKKLIWMFFGWGKEAGRVNTKKLIVESRDHHN